MNWIMLAAAFLLGRSTKEGSPKDGETDRHPTLAPLLMIAAFVAPLAAIWLTDMGAPKGIGHAIRNCFIAFGSVIVVPVCLLVLARLWRPAAKLAALAALVFATGFILPRAIGVQNSSLSDAFTQHK